MQPYDAARLVSIPRELTQIWDDTKNLDKGIRVPLEKAVALKETLERINGELVFLGLKMTSASAKKLMQRTEGNITRADVEFFIGEMVSRFHDEVADLKLLFLNPERFRIFGQTDAFGAEVASRFQDAAYDIQEAANCLALGLHTASVFHCMRVLEHGPHYLAKKLQVSFTHATWNTAINQIEKSIKMIGTAAVKPKGWKTNEQFYSEAATHFRFVKDAWRNYAAHGHASYDEIQADKIFRNTRDFMQDLSRKK